MRHNRKAQGLPLVKIVTAAIVLLVLVVVAMIGPGMIQKGFNNLLCAVGLCKEAEGSGDYILRATAELVDEDHVILHFTPNPTRCAEIRENNPYRISQGFAPYGENYIPDSEYEEVVVLGAKGNCGKERLYPADEDDEPIALVHPDEYGTHLLRLDVYGDEQDNFPLESVPVEVNEWERLLLTYLNAHMRAMGEHTLSGPYGAPVLWSLSMHSDPGPTFLEEYPHDQSIDLNRDEIEAVQAFMDDVPDLYSGTFKDFLTNLACTHPEWNSGTSGVKDKAFQVIVTALFGDIQDFESKSGNPPTAGQPVPRIRDGSAPRGWDSSEDEVYRNQLFPVEFGVWYPEMGPGGNLAWNPEAMVRSRTKQWALDDKAFYGRDYDAEITFGGPDGSCLAGKQVTAYIRICPEDICKIASEGGEAPEPDGEEPGEIEEGDCYVGSMDPCGGSVTYVGQGNWICMFDETLGVELALFCEGGSFAQVDDCDCINHPCQISSSPEASGWVCG